MKGLSKLRRQRERQPTKGLIKTIAVHVRYKLCLVYCPLQNSKVKLSSPVSLEKVNRDEFCVLPERYHNIFNLSMFLHR